MNRITNLFETKKNGILSVYFTAGYPQLDDTVTILKELEKKVSTLLKLVFLSPIQWPTALLSRKQLHKHYATACRFISCSTS